MTGYLHKRSSGKFIKSILNRKAQFDIPEFEIVLKIRIRRSGNEFPEKQHQRR
jgi:hypothetical protein